MVEKHAAEIIQGQVMSRDLRKYAKDTNVRLVIGALVFLFIVGPVLIGLIYGLGAGVTALLCLLAGLVPIGLIFLALGLSDWILKRANRD
jgi:hypothetical protein